MIPMWDIILQNLPLLVVLIFAIIICGADLIKAKGVWAEARQKKIDDAVEEKQKEINIQEEFEKLHQRFDQIDSRLDDLESRQAKAEERLKDLTVSDMHDIKSWIVEQYHKFYIHQGWIDAYSEDTLEKRYSDYLKEEGNSHVENLMIQLRSLPMDPTQSIRKKDQENK